MLFELLIWLWDFICESIISAFAKNKKRPRFKSSSLTKGTDIISLGHFVFWYIKTGSLEQIQQGGTLRPYFQRELLSHFVDQPEGFDETFFADERFLNENSMFSRKMCTPKPITMSYVNTYVPTCLSG